MAGAIIFVVAMVLVVPIGVMFLGAAWSLIMGWTSESVDPTSDAAAPTADG